MPKPFLIHEQSRLESDLIDTALAGLKQWRPDLSYPESHSDMQACIRGIIQMFEIKRRPLPEPLRMKCHVCEGLGEFIAIADGTRHRTTCSECTGRGYVTA